MRKLFSISELAKILGLIDPSTGKPKNYILRYWEKEFKQIKPLKINNRRYYSTKQVEMIKFINFLLTNKKITILGAKKFLNSKINKLDDYSSFSLKSEHSKISLKNKSKIILEKINRLKNYGKKNSS